MTRGQRIALAYKFAFDFLTVPFVIVSCFINPRIHPAYAE